MLPELFLVVVGVLLDDAELARVVLDALLLTYENHECSGLVLISYPSRRRSPQQSHRVERRVLVVKWGVGLVADGGGGVNHLYPSHC